MKNICGLKYDETSIGRVKMHTQRLDLQNWVKIDSTYASQQREKERLLETKRDLVFVTNDDPSTVLAKQEVLELLCEYLPSNTLFPPFIM